MRRWILLLWMLTLPSVVRAQATHVTTSGTLPTSCTVGDLYFKTGASAGFYTCSTINTWTLVDTTAAANALTNKTISGASNTLTNLPAANLTGSLPAISGASLTAIPAGNLTGSYAALNGSAITSLAAANMTGTLVAGTQQAITETGILTGFRLGNNTPVLTSPTKIGAVSHAFSGALGASNYMGITNDIAFTPSGAWSGVGLSFYTTGSITGTQNASSTYMGISAAMASLTSGTIAEEIGVRGQVVRSGGTTTTANGIDAYASIATGALTNWYGLRAHAPTVSGGGSSGSGYGLFIDDQTTASCTTCTPFFMGLPNSGRFSLASTPALSDTLSHGAEALSYTLITTSNSALKGNSYNVGSQMKWVLTPSADITAPTVSSGLIGHDHNLIIEATHNVAPLVQASGGDVYIEGGSGNLTSATGLYAEADHYGTGTVTDLMGLITYIGVGTGATATNLHSILVTTPYDVAGTVTTSVGIDIADQAYAGATAWALRYTNVDSQISGITAAGAVVDTPGTVTIGTTGTLTPSTTQVQLTCSDGGGCAVTMGESGIKNGQSVKIVNVSANTANFSDTSGTSELAGAFAMGQWDSLTLTYVADRWVEQARSNN